MESSINVQYAVTKYAEIGQSKQTKQKVPDFGIPPSVYTLMQRLQHPIGNFKDQVCLCQNQKQALNNFTTLHF